MIPTPAQIYLRFGKEAPIRRFHPWIFSGAIHKTIGKPNDGDTVEVFDGNGNFLALGHYHGGSIAVKIISYEQTIPDTNFWKNKIKKAYQVRQMLGFQGTNCYRLSHGEGDSLPGLILDYYNGVVVLQAHSIGMHLAKEAIAEALQEIYGETLLAIYDKSAETLPDRYAQTVSNGYVYAKQNHVPSVPHAVSENGHTFLIDWETGQKTGFFLDQRDNRNLLASYATNKKVLNAFCYSGGFSVYALSAGASDVHSVDVSQKAITLAQANVSANGFGVAHQSFAQDVMPFLKNTEQSYDVVVLDPPAYAKSMDARHRAVQGYKRLNIEGLKKVSAGGILFTFSCSQVVDRQLFYDTIVAAAIEAGRQVRVLHHLTQPADHPVNFFHPEGSYLKGLVLYVE